MFVLQCGANAELTELFFVVLNELKILMIICHIKVCQGIYIAIFKSQSLKSRIAQS